MSGRPMLPNWIIVGAPKAGTSSLFRWLIDHPDVAGPVQKETYYFVDPGTHMFPTRRNFYRGGVSGYSKLFESCDPSAKVIFESTPAYLYSQTALRELPRLPAKPNFIFVLREPVAQLRSLFSYFQQNWNWIPRDMSFRDFVTAADEGKPQFKGNELAANALRNAWYPEHLSRWRSAVGRDRMFVLLFEDLVKNSREAMRQVSAWMGIDPSFYSNYEFQPENRTYMARNGALQNLNVLIRGRLPQGQLYNAVRRLYRAINTKTPPRHRDDPEVDRTLARRYIDMLPELEEEYGLDLTSWRRDLQALTAGAGPQRSSFERPRPPLNAFSAGFAVK